MLGATVVFGARVDAAPTFTVNNPFDVVAGGDLTNGVCETAPGNGVCTLRAAVMKANHFPGGGVTINIPAGTYTLTIPPAPPLRPETDGALQIAQTTTIVGAGMDVTFIDGGGLDRVFVVASGTVNISNMTVGRANGGLSAVGGGIVNEGNLTLDKVHLTQNQAAFGAGFGNVDPGVAVINNSLIDTNVAIEEGGGIANWSAQLTVNNSAIVNNKAGNIGGGVEDRRGDKTQPMGVMTLSDTTVSGNLATLGGGISIAPGIFGSSTLTLNRSTVNANRAAQDGGGIYVDQGTQLVVNNSTLSANSAQGNGGGIANLGTGALFHATIAGNVAASVQNGGAGGGIYNPGKLSLWNSLLAENYAGNVAQECSDSVESQDYNYSQAACSFTGFQLNNVTGGDPSLGPLDNNGGATLSRALFAGSIAADQIPAAVCRDSFGLAPTTDQRNVQRPINGLCDMGAFEGGVPLPLFGANLIRNGDAEDGGGSPTGAVIGAPHWTVEAGAFTVVQYGASGGFPTLGFDVIPANHGYNFFAGGPAAFSQATQFIPLSAGSAVIDTGTVRYIVSGDFGGFATDNDAAEMTISFLDVDKNLIGDPVSIGDFNSASRNNETGLFSASASGVVPVGTRYAEVDLHMKRTEGAYNDGYADNLSLVLSGGPATPDLDQHGLTGSWFKPATSGQGLELEIFPDLSSPGTGLAQLSWFTYDTFGFFINAPDHQRWYTLSGPVISGQPTASLGIYENTGGNFNAPPVTMAQAVGTATLSFDSCTNGLLSYSFSDGSGRSGTVPLQRLTQNVTCSATSARPTNADFALSGNWYDPATSGQGFTVEINPNSGVLFLAWYTYAPNGATAGASGQRWFTALGSFAPGARSIPLQIYETTGGLFDTVMAPPPATVAVGSATLAFQSCASATLNFNFTGGSSTGKSGTIALSRVGPVPHGCTQ